MYPRFKIALTQKSKDSENTPETDNLWRQTQLNESPLSVNGNDEKLELVHNDTAAFVAPTPS